jgi:hypothetical protein
MSTYVVSKGGVVHVARCSAARKASTLQPWSEETQVPGDRKCHLCFPAVTIWRPARAALVAAKGNDEEGLG